MKKTRSPVVLDVSRECAERTLKRLAQPPLPGVEVLIRVDLKDVESMLGSTRTELSDARETGDIGDMQKSH